MMMRLFGVLLCINTEPAGSGTIECFGARGSRRLGVEADPSASRFDWIAVKGDLGRLPGAERSHFLLQTAEGDRYEICAVNSKRHPLWKLSILGVALVAGCARDDERVDEAAGRFPPAATEPGESQVHAKTLDEGEATENRAARDPEEKGRDERTLEGQEKSDRSMQDQVDKTSGF